MAGSPLQKNYQLRGGRPLRGPAQAGHRRDRVWGLAGALVAHGGALAIFLWWHASPPAHPDVTEPVIEVSLIDTPRPAPPEPPVPEELPRLSPQPTRMPAPVIHISTPSQDTSDLLSESQLAGAATADGEGAGGGGDGGCNTAALVQQALQRDPLVHSAVANANRTGKSVMLWNGDWVRSGGEDGKGLSAVREAVLWEWAFAPPACRNMRVHWLVLITLAYEKIHFAIGTGDWKGSDLLGVPADR